MKKTTKFALTSLAAGVAFAALTSTAQAQEQWTMTSTWPENLDLIKIDQHWAELVNQLAGDEVQINFRAGGTLMPGAAADIIVVRPDTGWLVRGTDFISLSRITPFEGQPVQGLVDATYVDGVCVFNRHA